ncbi:UDP-N-acetylmuramoyl-tripeptide--D-alanyl-D-alanine ligase [Lederbergia wuyishanensis]|uniref:UDP-N-acetylmuramoyl-tripeptide--D-alanyl-D-alanine ligase n=1 Tax=Lederbergia wuyishanensis TaxID=1347903 RepID=A0ABU0D5D9_9BACI|nr:UDP-N-acetylmuramoyl-tripeptide--D-alanyl-D-alanine ligase [Lederbergia wuyishanensis]MCJ8009857.1 UDP-N-acetylmuramoyl-tripeptide--D-alanyl-D-alanine ligase [Lederbergia wuyishanensis]MDQ0343606.1 UDP-N-acetylmuramoyl-tripeptide--D-alanyl-D-alanine ligase [Lederbergia wuyishanensis]
MTIDFKKVKPTIAVTGSAGKTTVKTMISSILREKWIIYESSDYHNTTENTINHKEKIGPIHRSVVLEYGMGFAGQITEHCSILQPDISVITNVGLAHIGNFDSKLENLVAAKSEIIKGMNQDGVLFLNRDDHNSKMLHTSKFKGKIVTIGIEKTGPYRAQNIRFGKEGMEFTIQLKGQKYAFKIPLFGLHNIYNALFAIAVTDLLGFSPEDMQNGLKYITKPEHRLYFYHLKDNITVIDDTVHAHPPAMKAAIDVLKHAGRRKRIAVLGSMSELGDRNEADHLDVGKYVANNGVHQLFTFGNYSRDITEGALNSGMPLDKAKHYTGLYRKNLHEDLLKAIEPGSTILVKGASKQNLFETVELLLQHYGEDAN